MDGRDVLCFSRWVNPVAEFGNCGRRRGDARTYARTHLHVAEEVALEVAARAEDEDAGPLLPGAVRGQGRHVALPALLLQQVPQQLQRPPELLVVLRHHCISRRKRV